MIVAAKARCAGREKCHRRARNTSGVFNEGDLTLRGPVSGFRAILALNYFGHHLHDLCSASGVVGSFKISKFGALGPVLLRCQLGGCTTTDL